ncbi:MAG: DUF2769 domain-containing protein [Methanosarcina flavescens]|jgi:hypothetical protein|uniref:DUF2769 domain-containing protein n=1 Tax=Methanosarcina flavescens TaxID=1715806 RepID=A0A660HUN2_9EURY|nr:DUF2769 domain-containing protein [Methanosarcina flavescens]AYK16007.1 DUF2769 domain-containing protein [Methanosarcina flavescens]NLK33336.1 DUF2769 domain-containing protein [Methanosarcina flavescens]
MDSKLTAENKENVGKSGKSGKGTLDIIQQAREEYGRYFGICGSYHHLKACICKSCPSYSGGAGMFCSRGKCPGQDKKLGCLCETCELFRKFRLEGKYFCIQSEKPEASEESLNLL